MGVEDESLAIMQREGIVDLVRLHQKTDKSVEILVDEHSAKLVFDGSLGGLSALDDGIEIMLCGLPMTRDGSEHAIDRVGREHEHLAVGKLGHDGG